MNIEELCKAKLTRILGIADAVDGGSERAVISALMNELVVLEAKVEILRKESGVQWPDEIQEFEK